MDKKEFLKSYDKARHKERKIALMIEEYRARQMGVAVKYSDMPKDTDLHDLSDYMVKLEEIQELYATQMAVTSKIFDIVMKALDTVQDRDMYDVLVYRYVKCMNTVQISMKMNMTDWNVYKLEQKGIEKMEVSFFDMETVDRLLAYKTIPELRGCSKIA